MSEISASDEMPLQTPERNTDLWDDNVDVTGSKLKPVDFTADKAKNRLTKLYINLITSPKSFLNGFSKWQKEMAVFTPTQIITSQEELEKLFEEIQFKHDFPTPKDCAQFTWKHENMHVVAAQEQGIRARVRTHQTQDNGVIATSQLCVADLRDVSKMKRGKLAHLLGEIMIGPHRQGGKDYSYEEEMNNGKKLFSLAKILGYKKE